MDNVFSRFNVVLELNFDYDNMNDEINSGNPATLDEVNKKVEDYADPQMN